MSKAVTIIRCQVGLCHTPTQRLCMSCGKPVCHECSTEELADMTLQTTGLFCDDCWKQYIKALQLADIRDHALADVPLVEAGLMSPEQCISYAQQYLYVVGVTSEDEISIIRVLCDLLKPLHKGGY